MLLHATLGPGNDNLKKKIKYENFSYNFMRCVFFKTHFDKKKFLNPLEILPDFSFQNFFFRAVLKLFGNLSPTLQNSSQNFFPNFYIILKD